MSRSISTQLIVVLCLCTGLILGIGMALDYRLSSREILARMQLQADETVDTVVSDLDNLLDGAESSTLFLGRILQQREYSLPGLRQMLKDIVQSNRDIFGATIALNPEQSDEALGFAPYYFHRDGILEYADLTTGEYRYWQRDWFTEAVDTAGPVWTRPYFDAGGGEVWMTTFAVPVYRTDKSGDSFLYAVVTADITLQELHEYLQHLRLGENGFGILLSKEGAVLSSRGSVNSPANFREVMGRPDDGDSWDAIMDALRQGGEITRDIGCPHRDKPCTVRLGALSSTGWPVGVIYSEEEILSPLREFQIKTAAISIVTLLLLALAVYLVTSRLTRPLSALARASDAIARGKLDVPLPAARGQDEVARLVRSFSAMNKDLKTYIADLESVTASRARLEGELAAAREIQMSMLPHNGEAREGDPLFELWARVRPAKSVGGDLYTYHRSDNTLHIAVGDVSDKGVPAALFMARAIGLVQQLMMARSDPARAMAQLNNALETGNDNCMFVTLFLGVVDLETRQLRFASAGHTAPSLLRDGVVSVIPQEDGPALGLAPNLEFPRNTLQLVPGDRLAIYTDGIDEAFNEQGEMFGTERFNQRLERTGDAEPAQSGLDIFQAIDQHAGARPQSDDITLMLLQLPSAAPRTGALPGSSGEQFSTGASLVSDVLDWLQQRVENLELPEETRLELTLVAEEIVTNIDKYAGLPRGTVIELELSVSADAVSLEARDTGIAFNPLLESERSPLGADIESAEIGGLGVHLITQFTDQQVYTRVDGTNVLRVVKSLRGHTS